MELFIDDKYRAFTKLVSIGKYTGVCDSCGVEVEYGSSFYAWFVKETESEQLHIPLIPFTCPSCMRHVVVVRLFKTLDITQELEAIKNDRE